MASIKQIAAISKFGHVFENIVHAAVLSQVLVNHFAVFRRQGAEVNGFAFRQGNPLSFSANSTRAALACARKFEQSKLMLM